MRTWMLTLLLSLLPALARAAPASEPAAPAGQRFVICLPDFRLPPYLNAPGQEASAGLRLLQDSAAQLGLQLSILRMPPERCRVTVKAGAADAFAAAPTATHMADFVFPLLPGGTVDPAARLARLEALVLQRRDAPVMWDGARFSLPKDARVCRRRGILPVNLRLIELGVSSEDYTADVRQALHQVANGHCALAVVWREEFARTEVAGHYPGVMALPVPLLVTDFYLVASRALASDRLAQFTPWWKLIAEWRELPRYLPTGD